MLEPQSDCPRADTPEPLAADTSSLPEAQQEQSAHFQWTANDAAALQPSALHIPKVARAWERHPASPYARNRLRVAKVWKRAPLNPPRPSSSLPTPMILAPALDHASKRPKTRAFGARKHVSPLKPVKKLCLDSGLGLGAKVLSWDGHGSPVRKIVTRSRAGEGNLIALAENDTEECETSAAHGGDELEQTEDATLEIVNEDGTVAKASIDMVVDEDWEDEASIEEVRDDHSIENAPVDLLLDARPREVVSSESGESNPEESEIENVQLPTQTTVIDESGDENCQEAEAAAGQEQVANVQSARVILPEGFVSPAKRARHYKRSRRLSVAGEPSRRRTLPSEFAPEELVLPEAGPAIVEGPSEDTILESSAPPDTTAEAELYREGDDAQSTTELLSPITDDDEWEDIEDEGYMPDVSNGPAFGEAVEVATNSSPEDLRNAVLLAPDPLSGLLESTSPTGHNLNLEQAIPISPSPTVEEIGQPSLAIRRSPRRQSSSPIKRSMIWTSIENSHLVAFTPVKLRMFAPTNTQESNTPTVVEEAPYSPPERATSAPPEEVQLSPRKISKPRLSDDTALLQAFLSKAAESRSEQRNSVSGRESISNRRDSDSIRQALASPARAEVLGDLDPNTPSPHKTSATMDTATTVAIDTDGDMMIEDTIYGPSDEATYSRTRRSRRVSQKVQLPAGVTPGPNKISIRANTEGVVLTRSEAQEIAMLTKTNTRRNKTGAVLPPQRLAKMRREASQQDTAVSDFAIPRLDGGIARNVTWAPNLVEFYQGGEASECSTESNESEPLITLQQNKYQTPSKPNLRQLRPLQTATPAVGMVADGKPEPGMLPEDASQNILEPTEVTLVPVVKTKRRARVATPGKALRNHSLLQSDTVPSLMEDDVSSMDRVARKKPSASKLPAPSSFSISQGKENLIASPAKKRAAFSATKGFVPKFDFNLGSAKLAPSTSAITIPGDKEGSAIPSLASPAKKARRHAPASATTGVVDNGMGAVGKEAPPGLGSPAKKRVRRLDL